MNDLQIYEIYDIWYQPRWFIQYFWHIALSSVGVILVGALYIWYRKRAANKKKYWHITLEQLARLDVKNHKEFYFSLTTVLKKYLVERYSLNLHSKTDLEMVEYLEDNKYVYEHVEDLKNIFNETTAVKFSHQDVDDSVLQEHLCLSIQVVKKTMPKEG